MEKMILDAARGAITKAICSELVGYNKPLSKFTAEVIMRHEAEFKSLIGDEVAELLNSDDFRAAFKSALHDKLARVLISKMGGELEKKVGELKSDAATRAKITLAVDRVMEDVLKGNP